MGAWTASGCPGSCRFLGEGGEGCLADGLSLRDDHRSCCGQCGLEHVASTLVAPGEGDRRDALICEVGACDKEFAHVVANAGALRAQFLGQAESDHDVVGTLPGHDCIDVI